MKLNVTAVVAHTEQTEAHDKVVGTADDFLADIDEALDSWNNQKRSFTTIPKTTSGNQ